MLIVEVSVTAAQNPLCRQCLEIHNCCTPTSGRLLELFPNCSQLFLDVTEVGAVLLEAIELLKVLAHFLVVLVLHYANQQSHLDLLNPDYKEILVQPIDITDVI